MRKIAVEGWNEWSEKNEPKRVGRNNVITLRCIGSDQVTNRLRLLSNEEYVMDEETGNQFMIGPIERPKPGGEAPDLYDLWLNEAQQLQWVLVGGQKESEAIWAFIQKSSQFKNNPDRDTSVEPVLELIDLDSEVIQLAEERALKRAATAIIDSMSEEEIRAHFGGDKRTNAIVLRERMMIEAETNPRLFAAHVEEEEEIDLKSIVVDAEKAEIIVFDKASATWFMDKEELFSFKKAPGVGKHNKFVEYLKSKNPGIIDELIERLS